MGVHKSLGKRSAEVRKMSCPERARLLHEYAEASVALSAMVAELARSAVARNPGFDGAWRACEQARTRCEKIQHCIYEHVQAHGCALRIANEAPVKNGPASPRVSGR